MGSVGKHIAGTDTVTISHNSLMASSDAADILCSGETLPNNFPAFESTEPAFN